MVNALPSRPRINRHRHHHLPPPPRRTAEGALGGGGEEAGGGTGAEGDGGAVDGGGDGAVGAADEPQYIDYPHFTTLTQFIADVLGELANAKDKPVVDKPKPDPNGVCRQ